MLDDLYDTWFSLIKNTTLPFSERSECLKRINQQIETLEAEELRKRAADRQSLHDRLDMIKARIASLEKKLAM